MTRGSALPDRAEVVVVGGGVMGASIAFHLAEAGVPDVLLLERDTLAAGSTSRSAGGVRAQFTDEVNIRLGARSLTAFERYADRPGGEIDLRQVGYLFLHTDAAAWAEAQEAVALQRSLGVPTELLTPAEVADLHGGVVVDDVVGATYHARDGYCSPESVVQGYAGAARAHGASVATGVAVTGVSVSGGEVTGVVTDRGEVAAGTVVCAAGPWSRELAASAGVDLPVEPLRRQILVTEPLPPALAEVFSERTPMTIDAATTLYHHREGPALLVGMSYADETPGLHPGHSDAWLPDLLAAMERRSPALLDLGIAHRWAGYYEVTPDHNALIGEAPELSRFLYATGFSGHGFLQGPAVGEVVRDLYLRRQPPVDVSSLSADRFAVGAVVHERHIV